MLFLRGISKVVDRVAQLKLMQERREENAKKAGKAKAKQPRSKRAPKKKASKTTRKETPPTTEESNDDEEAQEEKPAAPRKSWFKRPAAAKQAVQILETQEAGEEEPAEEDPEIDDGSTTAGTRKRKAQPANAEAKNRPKAKPKSTPKPKAKSTPKATKSTPKAKAKSTRKGKAKAQSAAGVSEASKKPAEPKPRKELTEDCHIGRHVTFRFALGPESERKSRPSRFSSRSTIGLAIMATSSWLTGAAAGLASSLPMVPRPLVCLSSYCRSLSNGTL